MDNQLLEISTRLLNVERRVDRLHHWGAAAVAVLSVTSMGYIWFLSKEYDENRAMRQLVIQMSVDITLVKDQQARQALESTRAWSLARELLRKGGVTVSEPESGSEM